MSRPKASAAKIAALLALVGGPWSLHAQYLYVGGDSVAGFRIGTLGELLPIGMFSTGINFDHAGTQGQIAVDPLNRFVFLAVGDGYPVTSFRIGPGGTLSLVDQFNDGGAESLAVDPSGSFLYISDEGGLAVYRIEPSGRLMSTGAGFSFPDVAPAELVMDPRGRFLYAATTQARGGEIFSFKIGAGGNLTYVGEVDLGGLVVSGIAADPSGQFVFADFPTDKRTGATGVIATYRIGPTGALTLFDEYPLVSFGLSLAVHPTGRFLYATPVNNDQPFGVAVLGISQTGTLSPIDVIFPEVANPASVFVEPQGRFLYVPSYSGIASAFGIAASGDLTPFGSVPAAGLSIDSTTCTADLPSTGLTPQVTNTNLFSPFSTAARIGNPQPELVTLSGSINTVADVVRYGGCPAATFLARANLAGVSGVGPVSGNQYAAHGVITAHGVTLLPGTFSFPGTFDITPGSASLNTQSFITLDAQGKVTEAATPPAGLVSWWKAEGSAADATGLNNGSVQGTISFVPGRVGQAFGLSGAGEVLVPDSPSLRPAAVTVMAWVKAPTFPGPNNYLVSKGANQCRAASYALYTSAQTQNLLFGIYDGVNGAQTQDTGSAGVWDGNWHFVAGTYDGSYVRLYVDGVEVGTAASPTHLTINYALPTNNNFYIGAYVAPEWCTLGFNGSIDEVRVFNRALGASEILAIYQSTP
jgi:6-phosphogluconolactonase (cycloisomerase 2 family)